ncbi:hypothetical protein [Ferruginibacter sp. SUN106]|uniref:hypothetical protein n=1 Tax=Ferruginibacter sp. SUN106 TaxID=2978348 RepID=UPI003D35EA4A
MKKLWKLLPVLLLLQITGLAQQSNNTELPAITAANARAFFIPATVCSTFKVTEAKGDAVMKVYNNFSADAKLQRVNDIRWQATSKEEALQWYQDNIAMLSEGGKEITDQVTKPAGVAAWNVYEASDAMKKMMAGMGVQQNQYTYTFVVDKYVAKIFVGVSNATSLKETWSFVKEGLIAVLKASGNPKLASLVF